MTVQAQREAEPFAPAVEAAHQVDRLALDDGVSGVKLVERVGDDERVVALLEHTLNAPEQRPDSIRSAAAMAQYDRNFRGVLEQNESFSLAAVVKLQQTWWGRSLERWQLWRRSKKNA
jgi:hypothetical protein